MRTLKIATEDRLHSAESASEVLGGRSLSGETAGGLHPFPKDAMPKPIDIAGKTFGRLTVLGPAPGRTLPRDFACKCACGKYTQVTPGALAGNNLSCGCLKTPC
jgi:hypothetical protein